MQIYTVIFFSVRPPFLSSNFQSNNFTQRPPSFQPQPNFQQQLPPQQRNFQQPQYPPHFSQYRPPFNQSFAPPPPPSYGMYNNFITPPPPPPQTTQPDNELQEEKVSESKTEDKYDPLNMEEEEGDKDVKATQDNIKSEEIKQEIELKQKDKVEEPNMGEEKNDFNFKYEEIKKEEDTEVFTTLYHFHYPLLFMFIKLIRFVWISTH